MTEFYTNYDEYSTGTASTTAAADFAVQLLGTDWTCEIVDQGGGDHAMRMVNTGPSGDGLTLVTCDHIETAGPLEAYACFYLGTTGDQNKPVGPALIASDNRCYALRPNTAAPATTWRLALFSATGTVSSSIGTAATFSEPAAGGLIHAIVGRDVDNNIYASLWLDGGSRPGSPMTSGNNTTLTTVRPGKVTQDSSDDPYTFTEFGASDQGAAPEDPPAGGGGSHPNKLLGKFGGKLVGKAA